MLLTARIWLVMLMNKTNIAIKKPSLLREVWDFVRLVGEALLIALFIRTFIFGLVFIPTGSMIPTLLVGDYLYVTKYAYGYSKYSFSPFTPPFSGRIFGVEPKLGDIVVFKGEDKIVDYIKRLVGLPGDKVQMKNGVLYINQQQVHKTRIADFELDASNGNKFTVKRYVETLPNGLKHNTLDIGDIPRSDNTEVFIIPEGKYFMMGDNRDNSGDSRFQNSVAMVGFEDIIGRADFLVLSFKSGTSFTQVWKWFDDFRTERMFKSLYSVVE